MGKINITDDDLARMKADTELRERACKIDYIQLGKNVEGFKKTLEENPINAIAEVLRMKINSNIHFGEEKSQIIEAMRLLLEIERGDFKKSSLEE